MNKVIEFWRHSWETDRTAFYYELVSFVFTVAASLTLALSADEPDMRLVYPGFFIGSVTAIVAYKRRMRPCGLQILAPAAGILFYGRIGACKPCRKVWVRNSSAPQTV